MFPNIFKICTNPNAKVAEYWRNGEWNIEFRRNFGISEQMEWEQLVNLTDGVVLDNQRDIAKWALEKNNNFSTKSLYRFLAFQGMQSKSMYRIWKIKIPLKIKIFLWQMSNDRLQTGVCLKQMASCLVRCFVS